ncbi:MAG: hypothetical protein AAB962_00070, partial [Patescibacteria group bacterium]
MNIFHNKAFIFILLLIVVLVWSFPKTAEAGDWIGDIAGAIIDVFDTVFNVVLNTIIGSLEVIYGNLLGVTWLKADGKCRLGNVSGKVLKEYAKECGGDSGNSGSSVAGSPTLNSQTATPIIQNSCTTGFILNYETVDALKYGIYRDGNLISQGFLGEERISEFYVYYDEQGTLHLPPNCSPIEEPVYDSDGNPVYDYKHDSDGNIIEKKQRVRITRCTLTEYFNYPSPHTSSFSYTDSGLAPNTDYKYDIILLDRNGTQYRYPEMNAYTECIKLDLKVNGSDEPSTVKVASNYVTLNWITEGALSCLASGDWSGSKGPATGQEELGKIARGTSNPGSGKQYNYSMSCNYPKDKTLSDSVSVTVFKYPECN